jgi:signal transduction histidine kinase
VIVGAVLRAWPTATKAYQKVRRSTAPEELVTADQVATCGGVLDRWNTAHRESEEAARTRAIDQARQSVSSEDVASILRKELDASASQVHDYRSLAIRVRQNAEMLQERARRRQSVDHEAEAIVQTAILMEAKMESAWAIANLNSFDQELAHIGVKYHSLLLMYLRIYKHDFEAKNVTTSLVGESHAMIWCSERHSNLLVQNLIDNALKYSPAGSSVRIGISETPGEVRFSVSSYGPRIEDKEKGAIFQLFYRGEHARNLAAGAGYGLALAKMSCTHLGGTIDVDQDRTPGPGGRFLTHFHVRLPRLDS